MMQFFARLWARFIGLFSGGGKGEEKPKSGGGRGEEK